MLPISDNESSRTLFVHLADGLLEEVPWCRLTRVSAAVGCEQEKLKSLPPLPATPALAHANSILAAARGRLTPEQQIELLLDPLQSQSLGVRSMALQVCSFEHASAHCNTVTRSCLSAAQAGCDADGLASSCYQHYADESSS